MFFPINEEDHWSLLVVYIQKNCLENEDKILLIYLDSIRLAHPDLVKYFKIFLYLNLEFQAELFINNDPSMINKKIDELVKKSEDIKDISPLVTTIKKIILNY